MPTVREITVALLRELGMTTVFGNPGSTELPMFRDFPADFRYVMGLQESVVLGMADGFAQGTGHAALVNRPASRRVGRGSANCCRFGSDGVVGRIRRPSILDAMRRAE